MFIEVLLTITKDWKWPKCPSVDEGVKQLWNMYKMKEILPFATVWLDLEYIMLSEISQSEKDKCHMILLTCGI